MCQVLPRHSSKGAHTSHLICASHLVCVKQNRWTDSQENVQYLLFIWFLLFMSFYVGWRPKSIWSHWKTIKHFTVAKFIDNIGECYRRLCGFWHILNFHSYFNHSASPEHFWKTNAQCGNLKLTKHLQMAVYGENSCEGEGSKHFIPGTLQKCLKKDFR